MLVSRLTYYTVRQRQKEKLSPNSVPSEFMSLKNNLNIERPLKSNSLNSTFKGLSFSGESKKKDDKMKPVLATLGVLAATGLALRFAPAYKKAGEYSISEFNKFIKDKSDIEHSIVEGLFNHLKQSKFAEKMVKVEGDKISFNKKTVPQLIWDGLVYPFKILPADILNGTVALIGKIKPLKGWADKTLQSPMFRNIRQRSKVDAQVNALRGLFEMSKKLEGKDVDSVASEMFQQSVKMFDSRTGNYDTKHERSLNRLVSGLPPAIFLANDAYNLSRMMDDDPKAATKEQKARFKQETARIGFNAYITLITLGALQKYINNSALGIFLMTGATTLTTEAFSRLINGKHITRLTPDEARKENQENNAPEANIKPQEPQVAFKANEGQKDEKSQKAQKPLLSFDTVMKASAFVITAGFGVKALRKIKPVNNAWKSFSGYFKNIYKNLTEIPEYKIPVKKLEQITSVLEEHDFKELAKKYRMVAQSATDGKFVKLGAKDKKIKPFVNFVIAPFKFAWNTVTLPYNLVMKVVNVFVKKPKSLGLALNDERTIDTVIKNYAKERNIDAKELKNFIADIKAHKFGNDTKLTEVQQGLLNRISNVSSLAKSVENIGEEALKKKLNPKQFQSYVRDNILKAFNADTMSNISNSELSNLAKTAASIATIWFLMTDNYNMVMLKSNGNDVDGAKTKFTERFVQEGSRLFYQTLLIDLFNSTLRSQYNKSLFGMSWITLTNTTLGEWLTRASVGVPVGTHSRESLLKLEQSQDNAKGFKKAYYDFMKRLTGKRSIKSYEVQAKSQPQQVAEKAQPINVNFTQNSRLNKIING